MKTKYIVAALMFVMINLTSFAQKKPVFNDAEATALVKQIEAVKNKYIIAIKSENMTEIMNLQNRMKEIGRKSKVLSGKISAADSKKFLKYIEAIKVEIKKAAAS